MNHKMIFENYFTTMPLIRELKKEGIHSLGVVRQNKLKSCPLKTAKDLKKEGRGAIDSKVSKEKDISVVFWFDNSLVTLASSFVGVKPVEHVRRWSAAEKEYVMVCRLACVQVYNDFMGGVDKLDALISYYRIRGKIKKWLLRAIYHFVDFALANSWLEYRDIEIINGNKKYHDLLSFRNEVADALLKAKLDPPPIQAANPVGRPRTILGSLDQSSNQHGSNGPSPKKIRPSLDVRYDQFCHFPSAVHALG